LKVLGYRLPADMLSFYFYLKIYIYKNEGNKILISIGCLPMKCAYHAFIIQILDVLTLQLDIKVKFANF
jgi:hypothetical protein